MSEPAYSIEVGGRQIDAVTDPAEAASIARQFAKTAPAGVLVRAVHIATGRVLYEAQEGRALRLAKDAE